MDDVIYERPLRDGLNTIITFVSCIKKCEPPKRLTTPKNLTVSRTFLPRVTHSASNSWICVSTAQHSPRSTSAPQDTYDGIRAPPLNVSPSCESSRDAIRHPRYKGRGGANKTLAENTTCCVLGDAGATSQLYTDCVVMADVVIVKSQETDQRLPDLILTLTRSSVTLWLMYAYDNRSAKTLVAGLSTPSAAVPNLRTTDCIVSYQ